MFVQEDWVLCRVLHKKKADTEYAMDGKQEMTGGATMKGHNYASFSSCNDPEYQSPPAPFPSLISHPYCQLPLSSQDHHCLSIDAFSDMPSLLNYDNILDFGQHLDDGRLATATRENGGNQCGGVLMDLGLQQEHYNYNGLL